MTRVVARLLLVGLVAAFAGACQGAAGPTSSAASPAASPAASAGAPASASARPVATGAAASGGPTMIPATEIGGVLGELPADRYTRRGFEPRITFEAGPPWRAVQKLEGFFDIQQQVGSPDVIAVQLARITGVVGAGGAVLAPATAADAVAAIRLNEAITVVESSDSLMDGRQGHQITVENPASAAADTAVLQVPPGPLLISPDRRLWIALFDTDQGVLAVLVGGSVDHWDEALLAAEPVLETVTIGR